MKRRSHMNRCNAKYKYISQKLDTCVRKMQRELQKDNKKNKVSYILASDELARRLLK